MLSNWWGIRLFDHLQKVSQLLTQTKPYNTLPPLKRRYTRSAGYTGGPGNIQAVSFSGDTGESIFSSSTWGGKSEKVYYCGMVRFEPTTPKNPWSVDDAICSGIRGVI